MAGYFSNPYEDNQALSGGAVANGQRGSQTMPSLQNAGTQQKTANPYAAMGNLAGAWTNVMRGYMQPRPSTAGGPVVEDRDPSTGAPMRLQAMSGGGDGGYAPVDDGGDSTTPTPIGTPPPTSAAPPPNGGVIAPPLVAPPAPDGGRRRAVTPGSPVFAVPPPPQPPPTDYGSLKAPDEFVRMGGNDHDYGTMMRWMDDGTAKYGAEAMRPYAEQLQRAPGLISAYEADAQRAGQQGFTGMHFVDWLKEQEGGFHSPLAGQMGPESARAAAGWAQFKRTGNPDSAQEQIDQQPTYYQPWQNNDYHPYRDDPPAPAATAAPTPPPTNTVDPGPPQQAGPDPNAPVTPPTGPPSTQYPPDFDPTALRQVDTSYLDPVYKDAMDEVRRQMMQAGAVSGSLNSGGFGATLAKGLAPIANQFASQKGQIQFQAAQANADRILDKFKFDKADDLQRWMATNKNALDKYGIDENTMLTKWVTENKAKLERDGYDVQKWIAQLQAQAQMSAAQTSAAGQVGAAGAAGAASMYNADRDYQLGLGQLGYNYWNSDANRTQDNVFNQRGYDLGVLGINRDVYGMDQTQLRYLMDLMYRQSPDARLNQNPIILPGQHPY